MPPGPALSLQNMAGHVKSRRARLRQGSRAGKRQRQEAKEQQWMQAHDKPAAPSNPPIAVSGVMPQQSTVPPAQTLITSGTEARKDPAKVADSRQDHAVSVDERSGSTRVIFAQARFEVAQQKNYDVKQETAGKDAPPSSTESTSSSEELTPAAEENKRVPPLPPPSQRRVACMDQQVTVSAASSSTAPARVVTTEVAQNSSDSSGSSSSTEFRKDEDSSSNSEDSSAPGQKRGKLDALKQKLLAAFANRKAVIKILKILSCTLYTCQMYLTFAVCNRQSCLGSTVSEVHALIYQEAAGLTYSQQITSVWLSKSALRGRSGTRFLSIQANIDLSRHANASAQSVTSSRAGASYIQSSHYRKHRSRKRQVAASILPTCAKCPSCIRLCKEGDQKICERGTCESGAHKLGKACKGV